MFQPRSLQQRLSLFMILPVALLMIGMGIAGFIYARDILLSQWQEAAVLKLERAAHKVDMRLSRIKDWIHALDKAAESNNPEMIYLWAVDQLKAKEEVVRVNLTWENDMSNNLMPMQPGFFRHMNPSGMTSNRKDGAGRMLMRRFHRTKIREITPPRFDSFVKNEAVSLISDLIDEDGQSIGRLEVVMPFDSLVKNVVTSGWWQSNRAFLVDNQGKILTSTVPGRRNKLANTNDPLERKTLNAINSMPFGTLLGSGHPPSEVSGFYKLKEAPWSLIMIAPGKEILSPIVRFRMYYLIIGSGFILLILLLIKWVMGRTVFSIKEVSQAANRITLGDFSKLLPVKTRDEVGDLIRSFNKMVEQLQERIRLKAALDLAMEVQQNLLPQKSLKTEGLDIAGRSIYCDETGGDYYDFLEVCCRDSNHLGLAVGDVSGHGISAALLMASVRASLRCRVTQPGSIAEIITDVNRLVVNDTRESGNFMTLFYAEITPGDRVLRWVRAGHDPALLYDPTSEAIEELRGMGLALGIDEDYNYQESTITNLSRGQILLIGTDGVWETNNESGEMFGKKRLEALILENASSSSEKILHSIIEALKDFSGPVKQKDDVTLTVAKIN
jgi:sigma-B regulation protein RsbU (phosphoserine phosphatase)